MSEIIPYERFININHSSGTGKRSTKRMHALSANRQTKQSCPIKASRFSRKASERGHRLILSFRESDCRP